MNIKDRLEAIRLKNSFLVANKQKDSFEIKGRPPERKKRQAAPKDDKKKPTEKKSIAITPEVITNNRIGDNTVARLENVKDNDLIYSLIENRGILSRVLSVYSGTRHALMKRVENSQELTEAIKLGREKLKDDIENGFLNAVLNEERWALEKGIDRLLHDRGYVDKKELLNVDKRDEEEVTRKKEALRKLSPDDLRAIIDTQERIFSVSEN